MQTPQYLIGAQLIALLVQGCADGPAPRAARGDAAAGRVAIRQHQCGACHIIPGIAGARGEVGPPLVDYRKRVYIAGQFPQDAERLARWIQDAPAFDAGTAMPRLDVSDVEARDIVAYLYVLR